MQRPNALVSPSLRWEKRIEQARRERALGNLGLFGFRLILLRHNFAALQVHRQDGVQLPLLEDEAAKPRPFSNCLKPKSIGPIAVAGALAVQFPEPIPDLLTGRRHDNLLAVLLILDQLAEPADELGVKDERRTALTSICSRMIRNFE